MTSSRHFTSRSLTAGTRMPEPGYRDGTTKGVSDAADGINDGGTGAGVERRFTGVAGGATIANRIKPSQTATLYWSYAPDCELIHWTKGHDFVSDKDGDSGHYSTGGRDIQMNWLTGSNDGGSFSGDYERRAHEYIGVFVPSGQEGSGAYLALNNAGAGC
jgi:hypothetical protein